MSTLEKLLLQNGFPDLPPSLVRRYCNHGGDWRIEFSYGTNEALCMSDGDGAAC